MKRLLIGSPRQAIVSLALIGVLAAALVFAWGGRASADDPPKPGPVTDVTVERIGTTRATVSFRPPPAGECPVTHIYHLYYFGDPPSGWNFILPLYRHGAPHNGIQAGIITYTGFKTYTHVRLTRNTEYRWEISTVSEKCGGFSNRSTPVSITFKTLAAEPTPTPTPTPVPVPENPPKPPKKLAVSGSGNSATISWTAPNQNNKKRCAISEYAVYVGNRTDPVTGGFSSKRWFVSGTSATVSGLTSGHKYGVYVASYSEECSKHSERRYSPVVKKVYTHP